MANEICSYDWKKNLLEFWNLKLNYFLSSRLCSEAFHYLVVLKNILSFLKNMFDTEHHCWVKIFLSIWTSPVKMKSHGRNFQCWKKVGRDREKGEKKKHSEIQTRYLLIMSLELCFCAATFDKTDLRLFLLSPRKMLLLSDFWPKITIKYQFVQISCPTVIEQPSRI